MLPSLPQNTSLIKNPRCPWDLTLALGSLYPEIWPSLLLLNLHSHPYLSFLTHPPLEGPAQPLGLVELQSEVHIPPLPAGLSRALWATVTSLSKLHNSTDYAII